MLSAQTCVIFWLAIGTGETETSGTGSNPQSLAGPERERAEKEKGISGPTTLRMEETGGL